MISTLPSLSQQTAKEVEGTLASLTLGMLPNPGVGDNRYQSDIAPELHERLIHEIRVSLRLKRDDKSPQAMAKIYDYLAKEIGRAALAGVDIKEVKTRLGQRGDLAPSLYEIEFTPEFKHEHERQGVSRRDVELTLQAPDSVEHVHPAGLGIEDDKATSLYVRRFNNSSRPSNTYSLLLFCQRIGYLQRVGKAWMIFDSEVDLSGAKTTSDVLRAFVGKYGLELTVGEKTGFFFWYERVRLRPDKNTSIIQFKHSQSIVASIVFQRGFIYDHICEIVYAFAINNTAYEADLLRHGIKILPLPKK